VKTAHLLVVTYPILAVLALAPSAPGLSPVLCLVVALIVGELWLRALVREPLTPVARLGLSIVAGLISFPLIALVLHVLALRIEGRGVAAGLAALGSVLAAVAGKRASAAAEANPPQANPPQANPPQANRPQANPPHPGHWVGPVQHEGATKTRGLSTTLAVGVPTLLALLIGGTATVVYDRLPHPAEPGYTSLALSGWAAGIARPIAIPLAGVEVPLELSSAGDQPPSAELRVRIGDRAAGPARPVAITSGTRALRVHVPAPADGCLHPIRISVGPASTVFYGRGPFPARVATRRGPVQC
jgi:hypothetical protein